MNFAAYAEYSTLIDSGLVLALAFIVWGAYRELRKRGYPCASTGTRFCRISRMLTGSTR